MDTGARSCRWKPGVVVLVVWLALMGCAAADETDNFYLPLDADFVDLGGLLEGIHTKAVEEAVRVVNSRIGRALKTKDPASRAKALARCHSADPLAEVVLSQFGNRLTETTRIERALQHWWAGRSQPGQTVMHADRSMNVRGHVALDPRALLMLFQARTIKACGVYFGTDKLLHFHHVGHQYYARYRAWLCRGQSPDRARAAVIKHFGEGGLLAEHKGFGTLGTGVFSNADMAANHAGFKFFLNLTEPVVFLGQQRDPLVVRCGVFWRVNDQVRPQSGWFGGFLSDHWNEALNPSLYDASMRPRIRKILQARARHILEFYTCKDHRPADPAYFDALARTLSTQAGEPYGHSGRFEQLMTLGNTCFPAVQEAESERR